MSKIWRCPECETINQGDKCIVCGYDNPELSHLVPESQKPLINLEQTTKPKVLQDSLKAQERSDIKNSQSSKPNKVGKTIAIASIAVVALIISFFTNSILQKNDASNSLIPDLSLVSSNVMSEMTNNTIDTTAASSYIESENTQKQEERLMVPNLVGLSKDEAIAAIESVGLTYELSSDESDTVEKGYIISQSVPAASSVPANSMVLLTVSEGRKVIVPSVINKNITEAKSILNNTGISYFIEYINDSGVDKEQVINQSLKPGATIDEGETIIIYVNMYEKQDVLIPNYHGFTSVEYTAELEKMGIPYKIEKYPIEDVLEGYVVSIDGGKIGEPYNGGNKITVYEAEHPEKHSELTNISTQPIMESIIDNTIIVGDKEFPIDTKYICLDGGGVGVQSIYYYPNSLISREINDNGSVVKFSKDNMKSVFTSVSKLKNLEEIFIVSPTAELDLSYLSQLTKLKKISISGYTPKNYKPLSNLKNLEVLNLSFDYDVANYPDGERLTDISSMESLENLVELDLYGQPVIDISPLSKMTKLRKLNLEKRYTSEKTVDISALKNLCNLEELELSYNDIEDLSPLKNCTKIKKLYLWDNKIKDISALSSMKNLTYLVLGDYQYEITDLSPLFNLKELKEIRMGYWADSEDDDIVELKNRLPECRVTY